MGDWELGECPFKNKGHGSARHATVKREIIEVYFG